MREETGAKRAYGSGTTHLVGWLVRWGLFGGVGGFAQWLVLRRSVPHWQTLWWVPVSAVGTLAGWFLGEVQNLNWIQRVDMGVATYALITGAAMVRLLRRPPSSSSSSIGAGTSR
ncbi:MAG: hypothetical protein HC884_10040 [Chloroflexaceae bacterium]|nr:hypothetical protein [Chloroflexaceae bacterium]